MTIIRCVRAAIHALTTQVRVIHWRRDRSPLVFDEARFDTIVVCRGSERDRRGQVNFRSRQSLTPRLPSLTRKRLESLAQELRSRVTSEMSSRMRLAIVKLSRWCRLPGRSTRSSRLTLVDDSFPVTRRPVTIDAAELELLRMGCKGSRDELHVLEVLLDSNTTIGKFPTEKRLL